MRQRIALLGPVLSLIFVPGVNSEERVTPPAAKPLMTLYGRNSKIAKEKLVRITSEKEWYSLWLEHKIGSSTPKAVPGDLEFAELDFRQVMVVAVFEGKSVNCRGFPCHSISEDRERILVRLNPLMYQSGVPTPRTEAWGILVLPRLNKQIVVERDVRGLIDDPPKWEAWRTFPAIRTVTER